MFGGRREAYLGRLQEGVALALAADRGKRPVPGHNNSGVIEREKLVVNGADDLGEIAARQIRPADAVAEKRVAGDERGAGNELVLLGVLGQRRVRAAGRNMKADAPRVWPGVWRTVARILPHSIRSPSRSSTSIEVFSGGGIPIQPACSSSSR